MEPSALLLAAERDARDLLTAARGDWGRPVPHCPEWDAAGLVRHTGGILTWMAAVVTSGDRVSRRTLDPAPDNPDDLPTWYLGCLEKTVAVLGGTDPDQRTWTFSPTGDRRVRWWCRRLAVEVAIHRFDAQHAAALDGDRRPGPLDGAVADAGIEEFVTEFLPGLLTQDGVAGLGGTLHLHATDGTTEWWIDLDAPGEARPEHAKADTAIRGTRSDLLLWLTNRGPLDSLEVLGNHEAANAWQQLRR